MKDIEGLRLTAKGVREKARRASDKAVALAVRQNIEFLETSIEYAAENGKFVAMSDNLCDPRYRQGSTYSQREMEKLLKKALIEHFSALGFSCVDNNSNYLTISWRENSDEQNSNEY